MSILLSERELKDFNKILTDLYSVNNPQKSFQKFLEQLKELVYFEKGDIYFYKNDSNDNILFEDFIFVEWNDDELQRYLGHYCNMDDALALVSRTQPVMFRSSDIFINSEREKTRYYRELLVPAGMQHSIEGNVYDNNNGYIGGIGLHRSDAQENFSLKELEILKYFRPHLANISQNMLSMSEEKNSYLNMIPSLLSNIPYIGIFVWDFDLNLIYSTLDTNCFLPFSQKEELIRSLITICKSLRDTIVRQDMQMGTNERTSKSRVVIKDKSYFLNTTYSLQDSGGTGCFVAMIYDYEGIFEELINELKGRFSLTKREFQIMQYMVRGRSNQEIAGELYITIPTVKKHLASIYQKLQIDGKHQIFNTLL